MFQFYNLTVKSVGDHRKHFCNEFKFASDKLSKLAYIKIM